MTLVLFFVREIKEKLCQDCLEKTNFHVVGERMRNLLCCESEAPEGSFVAPLRQRLVLDPHLAELWAVLSHL